MVSARPTFCILLLLVPALLLISSTCSASTASGLKRVQVRRFAGGANEVNHGVVSWESKTRTKRSVLEGSNGENSSLVLAAERTRRKDLLDNLNYYSGGWNITNKHYFALEEHGVSPNEFAYNALIDTLVQKGMVDMARKYDEEMMVKGLCAKPRIELGTKLISGGPDWLHFLFHDKKMSILQLK